jgi:hypothetical protein
MGSILNRAARTEWLAIIFRALGAPWGMRNYRETGSVAPKPHGGGAPANRDASGLEVVQARCKWRQPPP